MILLYEKFPKNHHKDFKKLLKFKVAHKLTETFTFCDDQNTAAKKDKCTIMLQVR